MTQSHLDAGSGALFEPIFFAPGLAISSYVSPQNQSPWVATHADRIDGIIRGVMGPRSAEFYFEHVSADAYHVYDKDGAYRGFFGVRSTAISESHPLEWLIPGTGVRAGKLGLQSIIRDLSAMAAGG